MNKLLDWIDINKLEWFYLSTNPNAIKLLQENQNKINWCLLSLNNNEIELLRENQDKICWNSISANKNAISLLSEKIKKKSTGQYYQPIQKQSNY